MRPETADALREFTLDARKLLMQEVSEQLEGLYGLGPDGVFRRVQDYPWLGQDAEAGETRRQLEALLADEKEAGLSPREAREKLVKEAAFTWLNRGVAFKMLEARKLVRPTITKGQESGGFKMWVTEEGREEEYREHERGDLPQDGRGEGPRQRVYRRYFLWQCGELSREVRVLFDADNLASRLFPRPHVLKEFIARLNGGGAAGGWAPGNEETIGWVYQGFNSEELEAAFREVRVSKKKFEAKDIPAVTQLFTLRWIVRFLVENTLGRLWIEMHPDSRLVHEMGYLVPVRAEAGKLKSVREIRLLDPACGTMHFGLVAFDLFVEMYREEIANAGKPGWPAEPPLENEEQIAAAIIANNIHGIDIDLRAVQLSALTLYLKARTLNPAVRLAETKLACADIHMLDGRHLGEFLTAVGLDRRPIFKRILAALQERLKDAEQLGSLLRLERDIEKLVVEERRRYRDEGRQEDVFGWSKDQFETEAGQQEYWDLLEAQVGQALDAFAKERAGEQAFFTSEATKGLRLLEVMSGRYDVVVTNPPYMSGRKMNGELKKLLAAEYAAGKGDLYAAFIQRCVEFAAEVGRVGMLTMHSFMFISSYEKLREEARGKAAVEVLGHLGPALFAVGNPGTLQTTAFVLRREGSAKERDNSIGTYLRLVKEPDSEAKRRRFEQAVANLRAGKEDGVVYWYRQGDFDAIPGSPWVYWIGAGLRQKFVDLEVLETVAKPRQGLATGDNGRFLRFWWEVGASRIGFGCCNRQAAQASASKWFPYMKGGGFLRWYGNHECAVNWRHDGLEIMRDVDRKYSHIAGYQTFWVVKNPDFYFRRGVTYSYLTSGSFSARLSPGGFIFDVAGSSLFPEEVELVLAILNSTFAAYCLKLINPTVNFQVGDLARLPIPPSSSDLLTTLVTRAIDLAKADSTEDESTYDFLSPPSWKTGLSDVNARHDSLAAVEKQIDDEVYRLYEIAPENRAAIEAELAAPPPSADEDDDCEESEDEAPAPSSSLSKEDLAFAWLSYAVGIVMGRFQPGQESAIGRGSFPDDTAARLRALADTDGVMVLDAGHSDDLAVKAMTALSLMLGEAGAVEVISTLTNTPNAREDALRRYLERTFYKTHIQQYRKRPVYWLLQSPAKNYSLYLFHEKLTQDTLYRIRGEQYLSSKIKLTESHAADARKRYDTAEGRERRALEKEIAAQDELLDDLQAFAAKLDGVLARGYKPHIDDGVLINMAPLWELIPTWSAEPKKCWQALEKGEYDWSHQALDHWPARVKEKCNANKSYAIAHGLTE